MKRGNSFWDVIVKLIGNEYILWYGDWEYGNWFKVEEDSEG